MSSIKKIAIDLDNTLIDYSEIIYSYLKNNNLDRESKFNKNSRTFDMKQYIKSKFGDLEWQKCQGYIYSDKSNKIKIFDNAAEIFRLLKSRDYSLYIVSHKTKYGIHSSKNVNIREIALNNLYKWLKNEDIFHLLSGLIFFEEFDEKIDFLQIIKPDYLIDDLLKVHETLREKSNSYKFKSIVFGQHIQNKKNNSDLFFVDKWSSMNKIFN